MGKKGRKMRYDGYHICARFCRGGLGAETEQEEGWAASRYRDVLRAVLEDRFPGAAIEVRVLPGLVDGLSDRAMAWIEGCEEVDLSALEEEVEEIREEVFSGLIRKGLLYEPY